MKIALFIPCYINALYPQVGEASYRLLRSLGLDVDYPLDQTCCGQPMANAGYERDAQPLAERMEELFAGYDYVVGPSASCVSFVREGYPRLVPHADVAHLRNLRVRARRGASRTARRLVPPQGEYP